ncbi:MAG: nuclear transport factor 2 family protein, partial [Bacteroidota bacterium]
MADAHHQLLHNFYASFQAGDADGMVACYHPEVRFEDPAFGVLEGERAGKMWHFLVARSKGQLEIDFRILKANEHGGKVHWEARYTFTSTGRPVHNR